MNFKNQKCIICGKAKNNHFSPMCINCSPYMYKKQSYPHQKARRRKQWKENREEVLKSRGFKCEWCGSMKKPFSIHHPSEINSRTYERIWNHIISDKIEKFLKANPKQKEWLDQFTLYEKQGFQKKSIKYNKEKILNYKIISVLLPILYEESVKEYEETVQDLIKNYIKMVNVILLCKRCHNAHRKGLKPCRICKKNFHRPNYDMCYQCHLKKEKANNSEIQKICSLFNISEEDFYVRQMEGDCLKCGCETYEEIQQYDVYLSEQDVAKENSIGCFCKKCFDEYSHGNNPCYIVKILN